MRSALVLFLVSVTACAVYGQSDFKYAYAVSDPLTGDHKSQKEISAAGGDVVAGQYKTLDPDGLMRTVTYKADPLFGFRADVDRSPAGIAPVRIFKRQIPIDIDPLGSPYMDGLYRSAETAYVKHFAQPTPIVMADATPKWSMLAPKSIETVLVKDPLGWDATFLKK